MLLDSYPGVDYHFHPAQENNIGDMQLNDSDTDSGDSLKQVLALNRRSGSTQPGVCRGGSKCFS